MIYARNKYKLDSTKYSHLNRSNSNIEIQIVEISKPNYKTIVLANTYRPPSGSQPEFLNEITSVLEAIGGIRYPDLYLVGDLNLDHSPGRLNETTDSLVSLLKSYALTQLIDVPTRKTRNTSTILDVMYVKTTKEIHPYIIKTTLSTLQCTEG